MANGDGNERDRFSPGHGRQRSVCIRPAEVSFRPRVVIAPAAACGVRWIWGRIRWEVGIGVAGGDDGVGGGLRKTCAEFDPSPGACYICRDRHQTVCLSLVMIEFAHHWALRSRRLSIPGAGNVLRVV